MRFRALVILLLPMFFLSCATPDKEAFSQKVEGDTAEFEKVVKIVEIEEPTPAPEESKIESDKTAATAKKPDKKTETIKKSDKKSDKVSSSKKDSTSPAKTDGKKEVVKDQTDKKSETPVQKKDDKAIPPQQGKTEKRLPPLEDDEGFAGRRPLVQPYDVGEEIVLGISYFGVEAGKFTMQVKPMVEVNGRKSYHFRYIIKSSPLFNMFYRVDDVAETFVDYETLLPHSYEIHVDESKQVRETRTFFDHKKLKATLWDNKQKANNEIEKKKQTWDILPFSQNVFSSAYYLRNFTLRVGKELKVRVGHEGKNIEMTAKVIRRETIYTSLGKYDTFVVSPKFDIDGKFKPTGENYLWLTADDKKFIVRIESKIKIGSIVGEVQKIKP